MFFKETDSIPKSKYRSLHSDPNPFSSVSESESTRDDGRRRSAILDRSSCEGSPMTMSPWNQTNPNCKINNNGSNAQRNGLIGSLVREEGHIYSLAARNGLLYTGSDSKNIRVWKNLKEFSGFKSNSGLVKTIVISGEIIFTGHQDGKIRVWKVSSKNPNAHRRAGTLPTLKDILKNSMRPSNYVEVRRRRSALWIKHTDAVSCLSLDEDQGLLYSASWDRTVKVWRVSDSKCLESIKAHDDAVNSIVAAGDAVILTGSADGSIKAWRREYQGERTSHTLVQTLLKQESAITAVAVSSSSGAVYCGSSDGKVNHWEWTEKYAFTHGGHLQGHKLAVLCLAAAGSLLFSGSADKTICVWRNEGGGVHTCVSFLSGHVGPVKSLAVEADDSTEDGYRRWVLYSGSLDKSVKVWGVPEFDPDFERTARMMPYQEQHEVVCDRDSFTFDDGYSSSAGGGSSRRGSLFM